MINVCLFPSPYWYIISFLLTSQERVSDPSTKPVQLAVRSNVPPFAPPILPTDIDDGISSEGDINSFLSIKNFIIVCVCALSFGGYPLIF